MYILVFFTSFHGTSKIFRRDRKRERGNKGGGRKKKINITLLPLLEDNYVCEFHLLIIILPPSLVKPPF